MLMGSGKNSMSPYSARYGQIFPLP